MTHTDQKPTIDLGTKVTVRVGRSGLKNGLVAGELRLVTRRAAGPRTVPGKPG